MNRRDVLTVTGGLTLSTTLAGCVGESPSSDTDTEADSDDISSELDLGEANVTSVVVDNSGEATDFLVELHHDDAGEDGYADWWQVETLDGTQLGRRDLLHAHENEQPFERSETIEIPDDVTCVVVRGHDQTHGYGGRAVVVNLASGGQNAIQQGSERQAVSESDCPA
ncbi:hypothetical protein HKK80_05635 [Halonotius sp. F2-221B]|uniref:hypothetical protein n=1 Tax=Halonotius sp. F2-221B TaxID=2731620 RepID=UPI00398B6322